MKTKVLLMFVAMFSCSTFVQGAEMFAAVKPRYNPPHTMTHVAPVFEKWSVEDVLGAFKKSGLQIQAREKRVDSLLSFDFLSNAALKNNTPDGFIQSFSTPGDLKAELAKFHEMNKSGVLTWSFVQGNILVVLSGETPEALARKFEKALYRLEE